MRLSLHEQERLLIHVGDDPVVINAGRPVTTVRVSNTGERPVQVGSHYHFGETNPALEFDRAKAYGMRLAVPSGTAVRFEPGVDREVALVPLAGRGSCRACGDRHGEGPGDYVSRISVDVQSRIVLRQELAVGGADPGWRGPAITGGCGAVGSVVLVDPRLDPGAPPPPSATSATSATDRIGVLTLPGPAVKVVALAEDAVVLRELLDTGVASAFPVTEATNSP